MLFFNKYMTDLYDSTRELASLAKRLYSASISLLSRIDDTGSCVASSIIELNPLESLGELADITEINRNVALTANGRSFAFNQLQHHMQ